MAWIPNFQQFVNPMVPLFDCSVFESPLYIKNVLVSFPDDLLNNDDVLAKILEDKKLSHHQQQKGLSHQQANILVFFIAYS